MACGKLSEAIPNPKVPYYHIPVVVEVEFTVEYLTTAAVTKRYARLQVILRFSELRERDRISRQERKLDQQFNLTSGYRPEFHKLHSIFKNTFHCIT